MTVKLKLAFSTCPNDTFIFHGLANGRIHCPDIEFQPVLEDVETLNQWARTGKCEISKLSFAALGQLSASYSLLRSGSALGHGCGPLVVCRPGTDHSTLSGSRIAVPGLWTTAHMLLSIHSGIVPLAVPLGFDQIMPAVKDGDFDFGVIIHEGRFTYQALGLEKVVDLGEWWEEETEQPIPLGCIAIRRDLSTTMVRAVEDAIRRSVEYAWEHPEDTRNYVRRYAQEMMPDIIDKHIELYVNEYTRDLGHIGTLAVETLFSKARNLGLIPPSDLSLFTEGI